MLGLRVIINGKGSMEPIYSNEPVESVRDAELKADNFKGTECDITVYDQVKNKTMHVIQKASDFG